MLMEKHHQLWLRRVQLTMAPHKVPPATSALYQPSRHAHTATDLHNVVVEAGLWSNPSPWSINRTQRKYSVHILVFKNVANFTKFSM